MLKGFSLSFLFLFISLLAAGQETGDVYGKIADPDGQVIPGVNISIVGLPYQGTTSSNDGSYRIAIPSGKPVLLIYSFIGFENDTVEVNVNAGEELEMVRFLTLDVISLLEVEIKDQHVREEAGGVKIDAKSVESIPTPFGNIESALVTQGLGVSSNNELSSAYSVRGGNFDENLVYVNGFEVYRPFLIRSGQQEGLSFVNANLVSSVFFSSGGFQAKYGDKMSSVLDVTYKRPEKFGGSVEIGLLGGSFHLEGASKNKRFTYLTGVRYKTSQYLLNSLQTKGRYNPSFTDVQTYLTYDVSKKVELEWITNFAFNRFSFTPVERETTFGVVNQVLRLNVFFEGGELDGYNTLMSGVGVTHKPNSALRLKWMGSIYRAQESESWDILSEYWIGEVESDFGNDNFGQTRFSLGVGAIQDHVRNDLKTIVANGVHKGSYIKDDHNIKWGFTYQREIIDDKLNEWERSDSSGYTLPFGSNGGGDLQLTAVLKSQFNLSSNRIRAYLQDTWRSAGSRVTVSYGVRMSYWDVNKEWVFSPRAQISFRPSTKADIVLRAATGFYNQPPFYREMRNLRGVVNTNLKAQKSIHGVMGFDWNLGDGKKKFKFVTEAYYKYMYDLVPYEFDNVLIRYFGQNNSKGYAAGVDFRLNGELVEGAESWISMSIMSTKEDLDDDFFLGIEGDTVFPGSVPRPTDQRVRFSMFFQDYLPRNENFKVHLNLIVAAGLPFGPPDEKRYNDLLRAPIYRRVDIGFSAKLFDSERKEKAPKSFFKHMKSIWVTLEIFNLFGVDNTVSYLWVKDFQNTVWAVPNFLTNRRINFRLIVKF